MAHGGPAEGPVSGEYDLGSADGRMNGESTGDGSGVRIRWAGDLDVDGRDLELMTGEGAVVKEMEAAAVAVSASYSYCRSLCVFRSSKERLHSQKIETMDLQNIVTPSADNVLMEVDSTVAWQIVDVQRAATAAIATMSVDGGPISQDTERLRYDILKQAEASLSMFIGTVNYSSTTSHSAALHDASGDTPRGIS